MADTYTPDEFMSVKACWMTAIRTVNILRRKEMDAASPKYVMATPVSISCVESHNLWHDRQPSPSQAYEAALQFYAIECAQRLTYDQWHEIADFAQDNSNENDAIRSCVGWFERRFEGMELSDGTHVYA